MRARVVEMATPRRIVAAECCFGMLGAVAALLVRGPTPIAFALLAVCGLTVAPAAVAVHRLEKRGSGD